MTYLISLFLLSLGFLGCDRSSLSPTLEERIDRVQFLVDQHRYQEGLHEANALLASYPTSERILAIKASIYLHKSQIGIRELLMLQSTLVRPAVESYQVVPTFWITQSQQGSHFAQVIREMNASFSNLINFHHNISLIPLVNFDQYLDVQSALRTLEPIEQPSPGFAAYRGLVRVLILKYKWAKGELLQFNRSDLCEESMLVLHRKFRDLYDSVQSMLLDFSVGLPSASKEILALTKKIHDDYISVDQFFRNYQSEKDNLIQTLNRIFEENKPSSKEQISCWI